YALVVDGSGNVFVADTYNARIQKFDSIGTFLTKWGSSGFGDSQFSGAFGVAVDASGNLFVIDNVYVKKFDNIGTFLTKWGSSGTGDGQFSSFINDIAVDASGNVFVS